VIPLLLVNGGNAGLLRTPDPTLYMIVGIVLVIMRGFIMLSYKA
jgi:hypothetical protein